MRNSEPFLPFTRNLLCKRIRFDDKLDLIDKIIPIDDRTCLLIDRAQNFHLKVYSPEDEDTASLQFPLPPYAHNSNLNVLYSVDYIDLYHYINKRKISQDDVQDYMKNLNQERMKYLQFVYMGDYKLAVQLNRNIPVALLDLHEPKNPPLILQGVCGVKNLISVGNECLAWYERSTNMVTLYHSLMQKRKILNFTERSIKELFCLKDHVVVAVSRQRIEILDYLKNRVIKSIGFLTDDFIPNVVVHSEANIVSYVEDREIHLWKIEKGRIRCHNYYDFQDYEKPVTYLFIALNLIALKTSDGEIRILFFDSKNFALHTTIDASKLGIMDEPGLEYLCCEDANREGIFKSVHPLGNDSFGVIECFCGLDHGQQRISVFKLENFIFEDDPRQLLTVDSIKFTITKSILFEEFRDPIVAIDIFDDTFGMFITEKARIFRVNLKENSVKEIIELPGVMIQSSFETTIIEKFFVLAEDRVAIVTRTNNCVYQRIVVFAFKTGTVDFDSIEFLVETEEDAEYSFFDMIKLEPDKLLLSYQKKRNHEILNNLGNLHNDNSGEYFFYEYNLQKKHQIQYDKLWDLDGSFVAMRHREHPFDLSFLDSKRKDLKFLDKKFRAPIHQQNMPLMSEDEPGIVDVRLIEECIACIQVKMNDENEKEIFVYNIQTEELLNQIKSSTSMIGTFQQDLEFGKREKIMIFGDYGGASRDRVLLEPVQGLINGEIDSIESDDNDARLCMTSGNFKVFKKKDQALVYESDHHKNFVCVLKSPNFKFECLRVFQSAFGSNYHKYIYKDVFEMIFGVNKRSKL